MIASGPYTILVYAAEATGKAMPTATIGIAGPELSAYPRGFALDAVGRLYVAKRGVVDGSGSVLVYAVDPTWHLTLTAVIAGSHTGLFDPTGGIALDTAGRLYIVNGGVSPALPGPLRPTQHHGISGGRDGGRHPHGHDRRQQHGTQRSASYSSLLRYLSLSPMKIRISVRSPLNWCGI